jgi:hypothetical protein
MQGQEPDANKNQSGSRGNTTNWERQDVRNIALPVNRDAAEAIQQRLNSRNEARTGTPNINRNARLQQQLDFANNQGPIDITEPGAGSIRPAQNANPPRNRQFTKAEEAAAEAAARSAQQAGDRSSEFTQKGELRGTFSIDGSRRVGINQIQVEGRDPAAGGRVSESAAEVRRDRAAARERIEAQPRINQDGTPHKGDLKTIERLKQQHQREAAEMERIRAARARRRGGR